MGRAQLWVPSDCHFSSTHLCWPAQCRHMFPSGCVRLQGSLLPPASSNPLLFGVCFDFLELISRQDTEASAASSHSLPFSGHCASVSRAGVSSVCKHWSHSYRVDIICMQQHPMDNHSPDPLHRGRGVGSGGEKSRFPSRKGCPCHAGEQGETRVTMTHQKGCWLGWMLGTRAQQVMVAWHSWSSQVLRCTWRKQCGCLAQKPGQDPAPYTSPAW